MRKLTVITISKKALLFSAFSLTAILLLLSYCLPLMNPANKFTDPANGMIVIDPGHGGIDGGANRDGVLEKDINLAISLKVKSILEKNGYTVKMTRDSDIALDNLNNSSRSRHTRDLIARAAIINESNAQIYVSIHTNSNFNKPSTNGAIVFYEDRYQENAVLAESIQKALNAVETKGLTRMPHNTVKARYYLFENTNIPGVLVETAFISNPEEIRLLEEDSYREQLATAICDGLIKYLNGKNHAYKESGS